MQQFCSSCKLSKCIWESWLVVVFVVCPLGGNVPKDLFHQKRVLFDIFQCSIHLRCYYKNFTIYNIFASSSKIEHFNLIIIDSIWSILIQTNLFFDVVSFLWATRLVETYPKTSFDKIGGFWKLKTLKKQTLLILWAARLVETYPKTSFDKIGGFWKL